MHSKGRISDGLDSQFLVLVGLHVGHAGHPQADLRFTVDQDLLGVLQLPTGCCGVEDHSHPSREQRVRKDQRPQQNVSQNTVNSPQSHILQQPAFGDYYAALIPILQYIRLPRQRN